MLRIFFLALALVLLSSSAGAVVIRDDVDDSQYRVPPTDFPALVDLPGVGHGVLIAPRWVVTAAHAITWQSEVTEVSIDGKCWPVQRVVIHPGYQPPSQALQDQAMATWDWTLFRVALASSDDIALIELAEPVTGIEPVAIHQGMDEYGQTVRIFGKGATGNGASGYAFSDPGRTELRRAENRITSADGRWICYAFDTPSDALPLEGGSGGGDSGGPVLVQRDDAWQLAGLASWTDPQSGIRTPGRYGQITCNVRLAHYRDWIDGLVTAASKEGY